MTQHHQRMSQDPSESVSPAEPSSLTLKPWHLMVGIVGLFAAAWPDDDLISEYNQSPLVNSIVGSSSDRVGVASSEAIEAILKALLDKMELDGDWSIDVREAPSGPIDFLRDKSGEICLEAVKMELVPATLPLERVPFVYYPAFDALSLGYDSTWKSFYYKSPAQFGDEVERVSKSLHTTKEHGYPLDALRWSRSGVSGELFSRAGEVYQSQSVQFYPDGTIEASGMRALPEAILARIEQTNEFIASLLPQGAYARTRWSALDGIWQRPESKLPYRLTCTLTGVDPSRRNGVVDLLLLSDRNLLNFDFHGILLSPEQLSDFMFRIGVAVEENRLKGTQYNGNCRGVLAQESVYIYHETVRRNERIGRLFEISVAESTPYREIEVQRLTGALFTEGRSLGYLKVEAADGTVLEHTVEPVGPTDDSAVEEVWSFNGEVVGRAI
ncbi:MAG: hypothetical protein KDD55_00155 [Bdellovibrionales bacterium]|nr:hypothetical protein [Bdellovibrionales bacterium]